MKSYEEMTKAVLLRAEGVRAKRRKMRIRIVGAAGALCAVIIVVIGGFGLIPLWQSTTSAVSQPSNTRESRLMLLSVSASEYKEMIAGVKVPQGMLWVRDVSGCSGYEKDIIRSNMRRVADDFTKGSWASYSYYPENDNAMAALSFAERLLVIPEDYSQVVDYTVSAKNGSVNCHYNPDRDETTGEVRLAIEIWWRLSDEDFDKLLENPALKLSEFEDTMTLKVNFNDGTSETVTIDVDIDDNGKVSMTCCGA